MSWLDITRPLSGRTAPWPGDTPFSLVWNQCLAAGDPVNLSTLTLSPHVGTHVDAPFHYDPAGARMAAVDLGAFLGPARVVALAGRRAITAADLRALDLTGVERLLLRTDSNPDPERFNPHFTYLEAGAAKYLGALGIRLVGTDAPSVDAYDAASMPAHQALARHGTYILENLDLRQAAPGAYDLIALPLRLVDAEASPVRAVLRPEEVR